MSWDDQRKELVEPFERIIHGYGACPANFSVIPFNLALGQSGSKLVLSIIRTILDELEANGGDMELGHKPLVGSTGLKLLTVPTIQAMLL